jgi:serine/threonine-protein phosphatase 2A regulatory subunit B''
MSKQKIDWLGNLKKYVDTHPQRTAQEIDDETDRLFLQYIEDAKRKEEESDPSFKKVPKFFQKSQQS